MHAVKKWLVSLFFFQVKIKQSHDIFKYLTFDRICTVFEQNLFNKLYSITSYVKSFVAIILITV